MVMKVKSLGLLDVIQVAISNEMHDVLFETDSKVLTNALAPNTTPTNEFDDLVS